MTPLWNVHVQTMLYLSLVSVQSIAVAADFTGKVPELLRQPHGLMGAESLGLVLSQLFF